MTFLKYTIRWYEMGKIKHPISAMIKPYSLSFKAIVEDIGEASRNMDKEASAAAFHAEIRALSLQVRHLTEISTSKRISPLFSHYK